MAKIFLQAAAIAAAVFVLAAVSLSIWRSFHVSSPPNEAHGAQSADPKENHGKEEKGFIDRTAEDPVAFFTLWLTLFTGILAAFTVWLALSTKDLRDFAEEQARDMKESIAASKESADAAKRAVELSDRTAERQLRAYIFPSEQMTFDVAMGKQPRSEILVKNTGQTPASEVIAWAGITVSNFPLDRELQRATPEYMKTASRRVVGPGGSFKIAPVWNETITAQHMQMLENGTAAVFIWGEVTYVDVFGRSRKTGINGYFGGDTGLRSDGFTTTAIDGNEAD
jgi:hypothetical protein